MHFSVLKYKWVNMNKIEDLLDNIATRERSIEWWGYFNLLPDPDPVLMKTGQDMAIYRQLLSDPHVWSCVQSLKAGVLSEEWQIKDNGDPKAYKLALSTFDNIDIYQVITDILDCPLFGMSPLEIIWNKNYTIQNIIGRPPEWFMFDSQNRLRFIGRDHQIEGELLPDMKFLNPTFFSSYQNPYGERLLSKCFWSVTFKKDALKNWTIFTEKYGMPWVIGKVPGAMDVVKREELLLSLQNMVKDAVAVINDDESIDIPNTLSGSASSGIYKELVDFCNREISKAILGQNLSTEIEKGGSYAAAKSAVGVKAEHVDRVKRIVCNTINKALQWQSMLNSASKNYPTFHFFEEDDIQSDIAIRDKILAEQGVKFTRGYYKKVYFFEDTDFVMSEEKSEPKPAPVPAPESEPEPEPALEFAENDLITGWQGVDTVSDDAVIETLPVVQELTKSVLERVQKAKTFEEMQEILYVMYPEMDLTDFRDLTEKAMTFTSLIGHATAEGEE